MRLIPLITAMLALALAAPGFAQGWIEYSSRDDLFTVNFPGEPNIEDITYDSEYWITLPGRVYSYEDGSNRYAVTVIDYTNADKLHAERTTTCRESGAYPDQCINHTDWDRQGAVAFATRKLLLERDAKLTDYGFDTTEMVAGVRIQLANTDESRTFAVIHMHNNRLYIVEGTGPRQAPPPALFHQSLGFLDSEGGRVRYRGIYTNGYPPPPRVGY